MQGLQTGLARIGVAIALSGWIASANADPTISMSGPGWTSKNIFQGVIYSCENKTCGGEAAVVFRKQRVLSDSEDQLNKPYMNVRALLNQTLLNMYDGQFGGWKFSNVWKQATKDYTAVNATGTFEDADIAMVLIFQGGHLYGIASVAGSANMARANLAKAFKSGDFRRPN
jgi:hypothetical protein